MPQNHGECGISGITTENATFLTRRLKHLESNSDEMPITGLIGMDILGGYDIIYDYDAKNNSSLKNGI